MTEQEIMKAMHVCITSGCVGCPLSRRTRCQKILMKEAFNLIKSKNMKLEQTEFDLMITRDDLGDTREQLNDAECKIANLKETMAALVDSHKSIVKDLMEERDSHDE